MAGLPVPKPRTRFLTPVVQHIQASELEIFRNKSVSSITHYSIGMLMFGICLQLGTGSFGEVFRAKWKGKDAAVKMFFERHPDSGKGNTFDREVSYMYMYLYTQSVCACVCS